MKCFTGTHFFILYLEPRRKEEEKEGGSRGKAYRGCLHG